MAPEVGREGTKMVCGLQYQLELVETWLREYQQAI